MLLLVRVIITFWDNWCRIILVDMAVLCVSGLSTAIDLIWLCCNRLLDWCLAVGLDLGSLWLRELDLDKLLVLALVEAAYRESLSEGLGIGDPVGHLVGSVVLHVALNPVLVVLVQGLLVVADPVLLVLLPVKSRVSGLLGSRVCTALLSRVGARRLVACAWEHLLTLLLQVDLLEQLPLLLLDFLGRESVHPGLLARSLLPPLLSRSVRLTQSFEHLADH